MGLIAIPVYEIFAAILVLASIAASIKFLFFSEHAKETVLRHEKLKALPKGILEKNPLSNYLGWDMDLDAAIYFPDKIRSRHVHIIGATGSGKTESVLLNLIDQDASRAFPIVILDAKGDRSFVNFLKSHPRARDHLYIFDPVSPKLSVKYNPLASGSKTEAAMRLFNSMTWSEEFYKTRAREMLMKVVDQFEKKDIPLSLNRLKAVFESSTSLGTFIRNENDPKKVSESQYEQLAGLIAQINQLCHGTLGEVIGDEGDEGSILNLRTAIQACKVLYFRLPALVDPATTAVVGKLLIAELAQYAAEVQAGGLEPIFTPVFLDEFGSLACPSFLELIAKARSAGLALHFSHQSMGDLLAAGDAFITQVTDNSSTKIVLRVYDPDTADLVARTFGNKESLKSTKQMVTDAWGNLSETGVMAVRDTKEFRADPDKIKCLPTGCAFVLMNHALRPVGSASDVFRMRFPLPPQYPDNR